MTYYVYIHVGLDGDPSQRKTGRGRRCRNLNDRSAFHKSVVAKHGIEVLVFPRESDQEAIADEVRWIKVLRAAGHRLVNLTDGGDGTSGRTHSEITKAKIAAKNLGKKASPETRAKQSFAHQGKRYRLGYVDSPQTRARVSAALKGNKYAVGNTNTRGRKPSDETRVKMAAAGKVKVFTASHRANLAVASKGREFSEEHRAKIGAAIRATWARKRELRE